MEPESPRVTWEDVVAASSRLWGTAHLTPVIECRAINERASRFGPCEFFFKCENLQRAGAFKFRGAFNAVSQLPESLIRRGVITHSSGNHAQALALAAKIRNAPAWIVMPRNAPEIKRNAVAGYGATITACEPTLAAREETAARITAETGATFIHPYNNLQVIAGQGTAALEMMEQVRELDVLVAPVGGGGLLSGTSIIARHHGIDVVGAEPLGADDAARSKASGKLIPQTAPDTVADGLLTSLGDLTWPFVRDYVNRIVTVPDADTIEIMRFFWERAKLVIEPSSAVAVAAAISEEVAGNPRWKRIGVILSGGNVELTRLPWQ